MDEFPTRYDPSQESSMYKRWEDAHAFAPKAHPPQAGQQVQPYFSIILPPPNVTGTLHTGHAVMLAIEDMMVRYHRMKGDRTVWIPGLDHAAIATQNVVEKKLKKENVPGRRTRHELGRGAFLEEAGKFVEQSKARIIEQLRAMGASLDWSRLAYTLDEQRSKAVREMFVRMYEAGILYRGNRVINWCPRCASTLADDEVEYREEQTTLYTFRYDEQWPEDLAISTTRPETKFGDTAVALHPNDPRAAMYAGQTLRAKFGAGAPELEIRVITDPRVDRMFGTGVVGVTPAHSFIDSEFASANNLPARQVITEDGKMDASLGAQYGGLSVKDARVKIIEELRSRGLITKEELITHNISVCYRCETSIEPLPKLQWFVAVSKPFRPRTDGHGSGRMATNGTDARTPHPPAPPLPQEGGETDTHFSLSSMEGEREGMVGSGGDLFSLKDLALAAVGDGPDQIKIIPERFEKEYLHWMGNLRDWCISRQIWFGHRLPVWYRTKFQEPNSKFQTNGSVQEIYVGREAPQGDGWQQDSDTLDTWFSSGMWTFSTLGWPHFAPAAADASRGKPEIPDENKQFHPTSVLETGYDILPFWVARMILMTEFALETIPFKTVYLHGLVRDSKGRKMSKSLGNVIDPLTMSEKYGADAVRLALFIGTSPGQDTKPDKQKIAGYAKFVTKLWNIGRYVLQNVERTDGVAEAFRPPSDRGDLKVAATIADAWILSKQEQLVRDVTQAYESFEFSKAAQLAYDFAWHDFADWYIEATKIQQKPHQKIILFKTLEIILKLLHPAMPFVTERLYQALRESRITNQESGDRSGMLINASWPEPIHDSLFMIHNSTAQAFDFIREIATAIRQIRNEDKIPPKILLDVTLAPGSDEERAWSANGEVIALIKGFTRANVIRVGEIMIPRATVRATKIHVEATT